MKGPRSKEQFVDINEEKKKLFYDNIQKEYGNIDTLIIKTNPVMKSILDQHNIYYESSRKDHLIYAIKNPEKVKIKAKKKSLILSRDSTLFSAGVKDYININYEINQPEFTSEDQKKKEETR